MLSQSNLRIGLYCAYAKELYYKNASIFLCGDDVGKTSTGGRGGTPDNFYLVHSKT